MTALEIQTVSGIAPHQAIIVHGVAGQDKILDYRYFKGGADNRAAKR
jgi:hypothetical protein